MRDRSTTQTGLARTVLVVSIVCAVMASTLAVASGGSQPPVYFDSQDYGADSDHRAFVLIGTRWPTTNITYGFVNHTSDLPASVVDSAFAEAFAAWASVSSLTFTLVPDCGGPPVDPTCDIPDIRLFFAAGAHGDSEPFDGPFGVLAHADDPGPGRGGDIHFDEDETWTSDVLTIVAMHEIGHSLGIDHTQASNCSEPAPALMCPLLTTQAGLRADDIAAVQAIYGAGSGAGNVTLSVTGKGRVVSSVGGISCPGQCSANLTNGTTVTFSAKRSGRRSRFAGWGGACASAGRSPTCTVTVSGPTAVSAAFKRRR